MMHRIHQGIALKLLTLAISCGLASAHQDTPLQLKDGVLEGLPKVFQPARFDLEKKILTIGGNNLELPPTLRRLFPDDHTVDSSGDPDMQKGIPYDLRFSSSWYHGPSTLPPYLQIGITPKERDFRFEILVDIQHLKILEANTIVSLSPNSQQDIPIAINGSDRVISPDLKWQSIIGTWKSGSIVVKISSDKIAVTDGDEAVDYPQGSISPIEPGVMSLRRRDGTMEKFRFILSGDILELYFERGGFGLVKLGSETDKLYERLEKEAEDGADQPATAPESKSEDKDKPQPESKPAPR